MEIEFEKKPKKSGAAGTRMYAPNEKRAHGERSASAHARTKRGKTPEIDDTVVDEEGYRIHLAEDEDNPLARIGMIASAFLLAGMILFMLFGYEQISRAHADINTLNNEIELTKLRITALDVEIECAVTIQQAQEAAEAAGMRYPVQAQYVKIGQRIPISGAAPTEATAAANPGAAEAPPPAADTQDAANTAPQQ